MKLVQSINHRFAHKLTHMCKPPSYVGMSVPDKVWLAGDPMNPQEMLQTLYAELEFMGEKRCYIFWICLRLI